MILPIPNGGWVFTLNRFQASLDIFFWYLNSRYGASGTTINAFCNRFLPCGSPFNACWRSIVSRYFLTIPFTYLTSIHHGRFIFGKNCFLPTYAIEWMTGLKKWKYRWCYFRNDSRCNNLIGSTYLSNSWSSFCWSRLNNNRTNSSAISLTGWTMVLNSGWYSWT